MVGVLTDNLRRNRYSFISAKMADAGRKIGMEGIAIYASLLCIQVSYAVLGVVMKVQLSNGMNPLVFVVYANACGALVLSPFAFFLEKKKRPKMSLILACQFFLLAVGGVSASQFLVLMGLKNTTPAFASAMPNLGPAIIFVMAWAFRMEKVEINNLHSRLKIVGTIICVCGAMAMSFLRGPALKQIWSHSEQAVHTGNSIVLSILHQDNSENKIIGCMYLLAAVVMMSSSLLLQAEILKKYPAPLSLAATTSFVGSIQSAILKIAMERGIHTTSWSLDWSGLLTVVFIGVLFNGLALALQMWCMRKKGPVFVAIFSPVSTVCAAILSGETLRLGSIVGVLLIFAGLYLVLWGKSKDKTIEEQVSADGEDHLNNREVKDATCEVNDAKTPLLLPHLSEVC
uniref:WAT1-related protein n=1 Tax=Araucaria cunninghamii TaxID=56994 RepID=A0A0D6QU12_ARACU